MSTLSIASFIVRHPLGSRHKIRCLRAFFAWQMASRFLGMPAIHRFVNDTRLIVDKGMTGATGNLYVGLHEFEDMAFVLHILREDDLFVDIGANIGSYTVLASGAAGARTLAFEPVPDTHRWLVANVGLNALVGKVEVHRVALGATRGVTSFTTHRGSSNRVATSADRDSGVQVPVERLDDVLAGRCPTVIKVDVEGFEAAVMAGAETTLRNEQLRCIIMEFNGAGRAFGLDEEALRKKMHSLGFAEFGYRPFERCLVPLAQNSADNVLLVRDKEWAEARLASAPRFDVIGDKI